jgi:bifunctional DNA-binding transcriptional regulator/antitoxin component of YhaV-PrlF toxin-antitoxin module
MATVPVGDKGEVLIPLELRQAVGIQGQSHVNVEKWGTVLVVRACNHATEEYTSERKAEFLLSNAVDQSDYAAAMNAVQAMGLDPLRIPHQRPAGV